jgi:hypothetical protein
VAECRRLRVSERAYVHWIEEGQPHGNDQAHWFRAEAEISPVPPIRFSLSEGPIVLRNGGAGVSASFALWDGIVGSEYFPAGTEEAFYMVSVERAVAQAAEIPLTEMELTSALFRLALAWSFSGGSDMVIESREIIISPRFESNATTVAHQLLRARGLTKISSNAHISFGYSSTYSQPPLSTAVHVARFARANSAAHQLLKYYHTARAARNRFANEADWFVNLYKVRDTLCEMFGGGSKTRNALGIKQNQWGDFGRVLNNNDFRHAEITGMAPSVSPAVVNDCFASARRWVVAYLLLQGLSVV